MDDDPIFEFDFCVALNMLLGKDFDDATEEASTWFKEARDESTLLDTTVQPTENR